MTEQHPDQETLDTARGLTTALDAVSKEIQRLTAFGVRNRRMIWGLIISITLDLILTAFVAVTAIQAHDANTSASAAKAVAVVAAAGSRNLCESSNIARAQQVDLWDYVLGLSSGKPQTAQEKKNVAAFRHHLSVIFAPRDCSHVNPGTP